MDDKKLIESCRICGNDKVGCSGCELYRNANTDGNCIRNLVAMAADRLEKLVPPCKIGDTAWAVRNFRGQDRAQEGIVSEIYYIKGTRPGSDMRLCVVIKHVARGEWGKAIFATREEAEAAVARKQEERRRGVWIG